MKSALISVVVPCFNGSAYLRSCVGSVLGEGGDVEVVIVDDGSTDDSLQRALGLAREYPDRVVVVAQGNRGQAAARNRGIRTAVGKYVGFLDVDDEYVLGFLGQAAEILGAHENVVAVQGGVEFVDLHRSVEAWQREATASTSACTVVARTETVRRMGGFPVDPAFRGPAGGEDGAFRLLLPNFGDVVVIDRPAIRYRIRPGSHFDYFLDRTAFRDGRVEFTESSEQEKDGSFGRALNAYREQAAVGMVGAMSELIRTEATAGANFDAYGAAFSQVPGTITAAQGFILYTLAKRWPVAGPAAIVDGGDHRAVCWLAAGCKAAGAGKVLVIGEGPGAALLDATLARFNLGESVQRLTGDVFAAARSLPLGTRLLFIPREATESREQLLEAFGSSLARHAVVVVHEVARGDAVLDQLHGIGGEWVPVVELLGVSAFERGS